MTSGFICGNFSTLFLNMKEIFLKISLSYIFNCVIALLSKFEMQKKINFIILGIANFHSVSFPEKESLFLKRVEKSYPGASSTICCHINHLLTIKLLIHSAYSSCNKTLYFLLLN